MRGQEVYIIGGVRTPMAEYVGEFKDVAAEDLGAIATGAALEKSGVRPEWVDHVVFGHVLMSGGGSIYSTRHMALKANLPIEVPALTVNRLCGSGIQAAISGAQMIIAGDASVVVAGGMESMSRAPHVIHGLRSGLKLAQGDLEDSLWAALNDSQAGCSMAQTAENCATKYGISREEQDGFAARSQQSAQQAWDAGRFAEEIVPVPVRSRKGMRAVDRDDHVRPGTTADTLGQLRAVISGGCVTAGNASGIVDGAAALVLASKHAVSAYGLKPIARMVDWATKGVEPTLMGMGPVPATLSVLKRVGATLGDIDLFEVNEAFAAQYLAVEQELGLDRTKVNVNGGAIALGHPLGMTGVRQLLTLVLELRRRGKATGLATACIGGGQGIAAFVEAM